MTEMTDLQRKLAELLPQLQLRMEEPLSAHTSFRIGGPAEVMAFPRSAGELSTLLKTAALLDVEPRILGAGTNVLAPDAGVRGLVICLKDCLDGMERVDECGIRVMSGVTMARAAMYAAGLGLSGLEFAHGIPGTVGGGVFMNAGAYGGCIADVLECATVMTMHGDTEVLHAPALNFSYRHSLLQERKGIVICGDFRLEPKPEEEIRAQMKQLQEKRRGSQPLKLPSAGSAFRRPVGGYAAALIDAAGLRGFQVGGAGVSRKHTGFVVNLGGATAADVQQLLREVAQRVYDHSGIRLEPEIEIW